MLIYFWSTKLSMWEKNIRKAWTYNILHHLKNHGESSLFWAFAGGIESFQGFRPSTVRPISRGIPTKFMAFGGTSRPILGRLDLVIRFLGSKNTCELSSSYSLLVVLQCILFWLHGNHQRLARMLNPAPFQIHLQLVRTVRLRDDCPMASPLPRESCRCGAAFGAFAASFLGCFCSTAKGLSLSGLMETPFVGKKLKS